MSRGLVTVRWPAAQSNMPRPEKFTAFAINMQQYWRRARNTTRSTSPSTAGPPTPSAIGCCGISRDKGQDALLSALQKLPVVGYINTPGSLRYDLHFARQRPSAEGGRMIFLMTDRYIGAWEACQPAAHHRLSVHGDPAAAGQGRQRRRQGVDHDQDHRRTDDGTIELENFANQPVMLNDVQAGEIAADDR